MKTMVVDRGNDGNVGHRQSIESARDEGSLTEAVYLQIAERAGRFLAHGHRTIYAADLHKKLEHGEKIFLLDIRLSEDYASAHIPGAVNVEFIDVMEPHHLAKLPKDGTLIVLICYTGHTASQMDAILNVLGYNAWTLRFGMLGWNSLTLSKIWSSTDAQNISGGGYPTEGINTRTQEQVESGSRMDDMINAMKVAVVYFPLFFTSSYIQLGIGG
jgi:rhodanese-related sulfurtransferase